MAESKDKFVDMVTATASVDLRLSDFQPRSCLNLEEHTILTPRYPAIDYHNHLDSTDPRDVLAIMDRCGVEHVVNITMQVGQAALDFFSEWKSVYIDYSGKLQRAQIDMEFVDQEQD